MKDRDVQSLCTDYGQAGVGVAQNQHRIRLYLHHQLIGALDDVPDCCAEVVTHGIQIIVRRPETEIVKKHLIEGIVIVLTGVYEDLLEVPVTAFDCGRQPDDLRPRADDGHQLQLPHV